MTDGDKSMPTTAIVIKLDSSNALGIASFVLRVISIVILAPVFVPIAVILWIIAVIKKQLIWGILLISLFLPPVFAPWRYTHLLAARIRRGTGHTARKLIQCLS